MHRINNMKERRAALLGQLDKYTSRSQAEQRLMTSDEIADFDRLIGKLEQLNDEITAAQSDADQDAARVFGQRGSSSDIVLLRPTDSLRERICGRASARPDEELSIGRYVKGLVTGNWQGAERELLAKTQGSVSNYTHLVPTPLSTSIIDRARGLSAVTQAGALTVPMDSSTLKMARITGDPSFGWKAENAAAAAGDMTFDAVTFKAQVLIGLVKLSMEVFEDAIGLEEVIRNAFAQSIALELDRAALRGSGVEPEPKGIAETANIQTIDMGENGAALTNYDKFGQAVRMCADYNFTATAAIMAPRTAGVLDALKDTTGQPLRPPASWEGLKKFSTTQIPTNLTKGTSNVASEAYVGDFSRLAFGMRTELMIEVSREASDAAGSAFRNLQVWIRVYTRADVQVLQPKAFVLIDGVL
ncbi:phage major capsid protein [uncultured Paludibaculum sp.]|uniref:phage major capsid protein n=1 Tax=uncultured Paludibaculum sp. TaxID=1765020 RepID=UPI002AAB5F7B|nr:phage major capsid protein [uncultured Paludibaculum sp.]